ncbi:MAG: GNAT family N-acetyltransferase [Actinomycetota bacterium]|nr:GNAT family N-acetyltransferase [Actinomycetota bacterium]
MAVTVRPAGSADVAQIHAFIAELAEYERAGGQVVGTPEMLADALFGEPAAAEALIAEIDQAPAGFALFHGTFSTWECRAGLWLEDLYVSPPHRRAGVGGVLLAALAAIAVKRGCPRLEWNALDWNDPALRFYAGIGAERLSEWELHRLSGEALRRIAA